MNKLVSVVIPTYNRRHEVVEAIEAVLAQTYRPLEIIVVDDGSTDGTDEELARFQDQIRYIRQPNGGPAAARNTGIRAATGEYVAFLDSDDRWEPPRLEKQVEVMERSPKVGVVYCELIRFEQESGRRTPVCLRPELRGDIRRRLLQRNYIPTSTTLIRRACFEKVGVFDEGLKQAEDWDLWIRISRHYHYDYVREPLVIYRLHGHQVSRQVHVMHGCQLEVVRRAFQNDPVDGGNFLLRRRSLAYVHYDAGDEYLAAGQRGLALRHLLRTVLLWPFNYRYHTMLVRALLRPVMAQSPEAAQ